jgi:uncharacterized membrane protein YjfL (UPF0719 family)
MERYVMIIIYMLIILLFLYLSKKIADRITSFDDDAAIERDKNLAVAIRRFGLYIGICAAMAGVIGTGVRRVDYYYLILDGAITLVLFFGAHYINDYLIVPNVKNNDLITEGNLPVGFAEAGSYIATGILLNGAFTGDAGGVFTAVVFFLLGQMTLVGAVRIHQRVYRFNITDCVKANNMSAGITVGGLLIAYSLILRSSITGDFTGWVESLTFFALSAFTGLICMLVFEKVADLVFLPKTTITEQIEQDNTAATLLIQGIVIALSLVISRMISL